MLSLCGNSLNPQAKFAWRLQDNYIVLMRCTAIIAHKPKCQTLLKRRHFVAGCICCSRPWVWKLSSAAKSIYLRWNFEKSAHKCLSQTLCHVTQWNVSPGRTTCDGEERAGHVLGLVCQRQCGQTTVRGSLSSSSCKNRTNTQYRRAKSISTLILSARLSWGVGSAARNVHTHRDTTELHSELHVQYRPEVFKLWGVPSQGGAG